MVKEVQIYKIKLSGNPQGLEQDKELFPGNRDLIASGSFPV